MVRKFFFTTQQDAEQNYQQTTTNNKNQQTNTPKQHNRKDYQKLYAHYVIQIDPIDTSKNIAEQSNAATHGAENSSTMQPNAESIHQQTTTNSKSTQ